MENYFKEQENKLIEKFNEEFPKMIEKKQCIYVAPIFEHMPEVLKKLEEIWEIEYKYEENTNKIWAMCPKKRK